MKHASSDIFDRLNDLEKAAFWVISVTDRAELGAIKLNKILWAADIDAYRSNGVTVTGQESYRKLPLGPVPFGIQEAIKKMEMLGLICTASVMTGSGHSKYEYIALVSPPPGAYDSGKLYSLDRAITALRGKSSEEVSELTHDALWEETPMYSPIPVSAASVRPVPVSPEGMAFALEFLASLPDANCAPA